MLRLTLKLKKKNFSYYKEVKKTTENRQKQIKNCCQNYFRVKNLEFA